MYCQCPTGRANNNFLELFLEPAHFGYDIRVFNRDFTDFSTEISGFRERFQISREISGKEYGLVADSCLHEIAQHGERAK